MLYKNYLKRRNYIFSSKFSFNKGVFPILKRLVFFYFIDKNSYKKNLILFFILVSLVLGGIFKVRKKSYNLFMFISFSLFNTAIETYLVNFMNFYLPLLFYEENEIKKVKSHRILKKEVVSIYYTYSPVIPEFDLFTILYSRIWDLVRLYRYQITFFFKNISCSIFYLRFYRIPISS